MPRRKQDCPKRMKLEEGATVGSKEAGEEANEEETEPGSKPIKKRPSTGSSTSNKAGSTGSSKSSSSSSGSGKQGSSRNDKSVSNQPEDEDDGPASVDEDDEEPSDEHDEEDDEDDDDEDTIEEKNDCNEMSTDEAEMGEEGLSSGVATRNAGKVKKSEKRIPGEEMEARRRDEEEKDEQKGLSGESAGDAESEEKRRREKTKKLMMMRRSEDDVEKGLAGDGETIIAGSRLPSSKKSSLGCSAETILSSLSALSSLSSLSSCSPSSHSSKSFPPSSNKLKASSLLTKCSSKQGVRSSPRLPKDAKHHQTGPVDKPESRSERRDEEEEGAPLDFSIKSTSASSSSAAAAAAAAAKGCSKANGPRTPDVPQTKEDSPLDLSCKRYLTPSPGASLSKVPRLDTSANSGSPWNYPMPRALTPPKARTLSSSPSSLGSSTGGVWNGTLKTGVNIGSNNKHAVPGSLSTASMTSRSSSSHGRQNPWQTQWINRSSEQTRDVFTCVWCKESFRSLQEMTEHMKASPRCGMAGMQQAAAAVATVNSTLSVNTISSSAPAPPSASISPNLGNGAASSSASPSAGTQSSGSGREPMSSAVLAKNSMNLPRKLVRGQDVWLGRGAEQTRQILKCMWCGQSFKTLDDMTRHMRVTQHYTNIISQEQIISWKTPEDKLAQAQVNAVLTCKVCDESFGSLKELSYHIVKNAHYKEHIIRSMTEGGHGRRRQTRERRKKSLPVRKLLELERMELTKPESGKESDSKKSSNAASGSREFRERKSEAHLETTATSVESLSAVKTSLGSSMITCDECNEKLDAKNFIVHIKTCKSGLKPEPGEVRSPSHSSTTGSRPGSGPPCSEQTDASPGPTANEGEEGSKSGGADKEESEKAPESTSGSVLSAIERLIEKSFDVKRRNQTTGILQRLGIDEEVCPPWQNMSGSQSSLSHFQSWSSIKDLGGSNKDRRSTSPVPSAASSSFAKENGSISSPSSSCEDSNSSTSLMQHNPNLQLTSIAAQPSAKLSFPISSIIANNEDSFQKRLRSVSPQSTCSNSSPGTPMTRTPPPAPKPSSPLHRHNHHLKGRTVSESSEEGRLKSPVMHKERKRAEKSSRISRKRSNSHSPAPDRGSPKSPAIRKSPSNENSDSRQQSSSQQQQQLGAGASFHPLMELQKLLDKTDSGSKKQNNNNSAGVASKLTASGSSSLLAFNWAFSEASTASTATTSSAAAAAAAAATATQNQPSNQLQPNCIKCAFCETQFVSKGAYRHHLSKIHFINSSEKESQKEAEKNSKSLAQHGQGHGQAQELSNSSNGGHTSAGQSGPESPHSKFLKYTELAKQLSSKYV